MTDEEKLVIGAKKLDPEAWRRIYDRDYRKIYTFIYRRVGNSSLAEDLTSGVFLRALEGIAKYKYQGFTLTAWFLAISRNLVADHFRRTGRAPEQPLDLDVASGKPTPEQLVEGTWQRGVLYRAMEHLNEEQRQVVTLRFIDGLSTSEVGHLMNRRGGAVRALQHRAIASLRRIMTKEAQNEEELRYCVG